jgi:hypothetical protein
MELEVHVLDFRSAGEQKWPDSPDPFTYRLFHAILYEDQFYSNSPLPSLQQEALHRIRWVIRPPEDFRPIMGEILDGQVTRVVLVRTTRQDGCYTDIIDEVNEEGAGFRLYEFVVDESPFPIPPSPFHVIQDVSNSAVQEDLVTHFDNQSRSPAICLREVSVCLAQAGLSSEAPLPSEVVLHASLESFVASYPSWLAYHEILRRQRADIGTRRRIPKPIGPMIVYLTSHPFSRDDPASAAGKAVQVAIHRLRLLAKTLSAAGKNRLPKFVVAASYCKQPEPGVSPALASSLLYDRDLIAQFQTLSCTLAVRVLVKDRAASPWSHEDVDQLDGRG